MLMGSMAKELRHENWYRVEAFQDIDIGLGRCSTGLSNPEDQPVWNAEETSCIFMEGEIFDYKENLKKLVDLGYTFQGESQAEYILHMYEAYGEDFVTYLNGAFVVAIWDKSIK